jgi:hypothetical protein
VSKDYPEARPLDHADAAERVGRELAENARAGSPA